MACYMQDICQYPNCGKRFDNLHDLIIHIEALHIDFEEADSCEFGNYSRFTYVPMSYIMKYANDEEIANAQSAEHEDTISYSSLQQDDITSYNQPRIETSRTQYLESEINAYSTSTNRKRERESKRESHRHSQNHDYKDYKPKKYVCPVEGCDKSYKNQNGMKYHITNYHEMNGNTKKPARKKEHKCQYCHKMYKTYRGLQAHILTHPEAPALPDRKSQHANQASLALQNPNYASKQQEKDPRMTGMPAIASPQLIPNMTSFYGPQNSISPGYYIDESMIPRYPNSYDSAGIIRNHYLETENNQRVIMQQNASNGVQNKIYEHQQTFYKEYYSLGSNPTGTQKWPQYEGAHYNNSTVDIEPHYNGFMHPPVGIRQYTTENGTLVHPRYSEQFQMQLEHMQHQQQQRNLHEHYAIYNHPERVSNVSAMSGVNESHVNSESIQKDNFNTYDSYDRINRTESNDSIDVEF